jgi:hypothetical protein
MAYQRLPGVVTKVFTYHRDALALLVEMVPTTKSHGQFLSELIRTEYARREERARLRHNVTRMQEAREAARAAIVQEAEVCAAPA